MTTPDLEPHTHDHAFGQDVARPGERRTLLVVLLTATMMVGEIITGIAFGSMALLADGLHMASHAVALGLAYFAYVYARRHAHDPRFSFGTGKVNALGGFTGALLLAVFAAFMAVESTQRFFAPVTILFDQAIVVACLGLAVNVVSALILKHEHHGHHHHDHGHHHHGHGHHHHDHAHTHEQDHNLRSAYLHVLADAVTSLAAIVALLAGKYFGLNWMDPAMGLVGSALVATWSWTLLRDSGRVLLDHQAPAPLLDGVRAALEGEDGARVADLHVWSVGPGIWAASAVVVAPEPATPAQLVGRIPEDLAIVHTTIEVRQGDEKPQGAAPGRG